MLQIREYRDTVAIEKDDTLLRVSRDGEKVEVYFEKTIYDDSTYEEYIEIPKNYSERAINYVLELIRTGFEDVSTMINPIDIRYHRDFVELKYPVVRWMTQKQLKELKESSKRVIKYLKKRDSLIPLKSSYEYAEDFKVIKRSGDARLVYYYFTEARTCEEDCPYVPKAIELVAYGTKTITGLSLAKRFIMKVVRNLMRPTTQELKQIDKAVSKLLGMFKKKEVKLDVEDSSIDSKTITVKITEPGVSDSKEFYIDFLPVRVTGSKNRAILVSSVDFELPKPSKKNVRAIFSLIRKYFKVKPEKRSRGIEINVVVPLSLFVSFVSELTGVPKAQIKRVFAS